MQVFEPFVNDTRMKIEKFTNDMKVLKADIQKVGELYGENKEYKTKDFLTSLITFATTIRNILNKLEADLQKAEQIKKALLDKEKAAKAKTENFFFKIQVQKSGR